MKTDMMLWNWKPKVSLYMYALSGGYHLVAAGIIRGSYCSIDMAFCDLRADLMRDTRLERQQCCVRLFGARLEQKDGNILGET